MLKYTGGKGVDEPSSEEFPMSSIPQGPAPAKIVKWQIIKTGKRGAYQIIREDNTDVVYVNFPGLLNDCNKEMISEEWAAHIIYADEVKYPHATRVCNSLLV
ncbi:hypothetical protein Tco_0736614 [Tanacetum coccineum]